MVKEHSYFLNNKDNIAPITSKTAIAISSNCNARKTQTTHVVNNNHLIIFSFFKIFILLFFNYKGTGPLLLNLLSYERPADTRP